MEEEINRFYQAKYGMFTGHDMTMRHHQGKTRFDQELIMYWNRNETDRRFTWYLAIAYVLSLGKIKLDDL